MKTARANIVVSIATISLMIATLWPVGVFCAEIHDAAKKGNLDRVKALISTGIDGNSVSEKDTINFGGQMVELSGNTPLMLAAQGGHLEVVKFLLAKGARLDLANSEGWTVLHYASVPGPDSFIRGKGGKLFKLESDASVETVKFLIQKGANPNTTDKYGQSPLHLAAAIGYKRISEVLLEAGAKTDLKTVRGDTPLAVAQPEVKEIIASYSHRKTLYSKETVLELQKKLTELGYNPGPIDGIWGKKTKTALEKFQRDNGLPVSGQLDSKTKETLGTKEEKKLVVTQKDAEFEQELADLKHKKASVRWRTAVALGRRGDPAAVPSLIAALKDPDEEVRSWTCYALAMIAQKAGSTKINKTVPHLIAALKDSSPKVRESAASALGASRDERALNALEALLKDPDPDVRTAAKSAISEIKGEVRRIRF